MKELLLVPKPQKLVVKDGIYACGRTLAVSFPEALASLAPAVASIGKDYFVLSENTQVHFTNQPQLEAEGYTLQVKPDGVHIGWGDVAGAFYGLMTLKQLMDNVFGVAAGTDGAGLPCLEITDFPQVKNRAYMLDISRGKVPTVETIKELIDTLAEFKYNHFELYLEGFAFLYDSFAKYCDEKSSLTPAEIRELDVYCKERMIDLVPNQNCYGHMAPWLAQPEFRPLAEAPDGWKIGGMTLPPTTLNARDEGSAKLIEKMTADYLPNFTSKLFNFNMDEPFDMGLGQNMDFAKEHGKEQLYLMHVLKMYDIAKAYGKTMMIWGDVVVKYPHILDQMPEDIVIMDWGYEAEFPVDRHARLLKEHHRRFYTCPGTNSWATCTGLTDSALTNIKNAVVASVAHGGEGVMLTDWGDGGHLQYAPISNPPIVYAAQWMWRHEDIAEEALAAALDMFIFKDRAGVMGQLSLDAGRYDHLEEFKMPCRAISTMVCESGLTNRESFLSLVKMKIFVNEHCCQPEVLDAYPPCYPEDAKVDVAGISAYLDALIDRLDKTDMQCSDAALIVREYTNAMRFVKLLTAVRQLCLDSAKDPELAPVIDQLMSEHEAVWMARNKVSGLNQGMDMLARMKATLLA